MEKKIVIEKVTEAFDRLRAVVEDINASHYDMANAIDSERSVLSRFLEEE